MFRLRIPSSGAAVSPLRPVDQARAEPALRAALQNSLIDLRSVTRAQAIDISAAPRAPGASAVPVPELDGLWVTIDE